MQVYDVSVGGGFLESRRLIFIITPSSVVGVSEKTSQNQF